MSLEPIGFETIVNRKKSKRRPARTEREYWLDLTAKMLQKPYIQMLKLLEIWPTDWIKDLYLECKDKPALWWHLYEKSKVDN